MDGKFRAKDIYMQSRKNDNEPQPTQVLLKQIFVDLRDFLLKTPADQKFKFREFYKILRSSSQVPDFDPMKASTAFENIEFYLILISKYPWKPEFKVMKPYVGFFQTKIESHLKHTEEIFKLMGYMEVQGSKLMLSKRLNIDITLAVAFECLLASVECSIISEIHQCVGDRCDVSKVVKCRLEHSGSIDDMVARLKKQYDLSSYVYIDARKVDTRTHLKPLSDIQADYVGSSPSSPTEAPVPRGFDKDQNVPYIDEDPERNENQGFEEGTLDDHLMASLRLVSSTSEKDKRTVSSQEPKKASDEWSFVHDKLRKDFGDSYYHGERGDVLRDEGICLDKDESERETGVVSHMGSKRTSGYVSASQGDRSKSVIHGVNSRKITQDSGIAERSPLPSQQVFYPPEDVVASFSRSRGPASSTVIGELPRQRSSVYAHAELAKSYPGGNSYEARGVTSPVHESGGARVESREINSVSNPASFSNFSHSAPILRKTAAGSEFVAGGTQIQNKRWSADSWVCPHCTVQNNATLSVCVVCGKSRTDPVRKTVVQQQFESQQKKHCPLCTFLNVLDAVECEVCRGAFM